LSAAVLAVTLATIGADTSDLDNRRAFLLRASDQWWLSTSMAVSMLQDPYLESRALAARVLACNPQPSRLRLLQAYAADTSPAARYRALIAAGRLGPEALQVALGALSDEVPLVRQSAVWAASHGGAPAAKEIARLLLTERNQAVLETALANLWRVGDLQWEPHVARYATHTDPILRRAAAYSLARSSSEGRLRALATLCGDPEPVIRATALAGLEQGPIGAAERELVLAALSDPDWRVQVAACGVLAARPELTLPRAPAQLLKERWSAGHPHLAVAALEAAAAHPEAGENSDLEGLLAGSEPWLSATALVTLARRGAPAVAKVSERWFGEEELWRRRAAARAVVHLPQKAAAALEQRVFEDQRAAVRLAWLEALEPDAVGPRAQLLWRLVEGDPDEAVRARALDLLGEAGRADAVDRLLALYRRWRDDTMPDARAAALVVALTSSDDPEMRNAVLATATSDSDPAVAAQVVAAARREGFDGVLPEREPRHGGKWYRDLVRWIAEEHWLDVVTERGTFRIRLEPAETPITAREVWDLAREEFYDGLTFHRVVPNFVVQGGDPRGDGWGGPGFVLPDEPTLKPFDSWRVGIATSGPNTGGCQFFVTLLPADRLTGHYTNFGEVVAGREVLTRLQVGDRIVRVETVSGPEPPPLTPASPPPAQSSVISNQ
jgi:cyclophilin family peptidyl-prolyl cis-trans isomerase/HEAT repeat protein